ncbi:MAG TPA: tRNA (N(6)-L-threonylcarbamoyladenosine(37)-C(2))-methylthiotransferase MtaB [Micropepsaceae bacterium]|nr:tRNA (N(6)-L-threonylcarbamoyladenosine(37)-C(2))-methylthiotransferase MtaB [Micropepsaceae bacterium]
MSSLQILTFGCRLNAYESEVIRARAVEAGLSNAVIVNTCAVTAEAVRQSRQAIRKARRDNPTARIIVTGCAAQTEPGLYAAMPEVDRVIGNQEKLSRESFGQDLLDNAPRVIVNDIMAVKETAAHFLATDSDPFEGKARAVLQVQNGCDHRCTFCIIPYGRGNSRSVGAGAVVEETRRLVESGFKEIVLSGVDLTAYGGDLPGKPKLGLLIARILKHVPELERLRLSSIDCIEVDDTLFKLIAEEERLMPHFHLSAQSGDNLILKRMKRRHSREDTIRFCDTVRRLRPNVAFGADLIAGFPTETEAMFQHSLSLVDDAGLSYLHVFPFSARARTPAAKMPQLPRWVVKERAQRLRSKGSVALSTRLDALVGTEQEILVEKHGLGRTPCFAQVRLEGYVLPGEVVSARIQFADSQFLLANVSSYPTTIGVQALPA